MGGKRISLDTPRPVQLKSPVDMAKQPLLVALLCVAVLATSTATVAADGVPFTHLDVLHVPLADLQAGDAHTLEKVRQAATKHGIFAVTGAVPDGHQDQTLQSFSACLQSEAVTSTLQKVVLGDKTERITLATATNASVAHPMPAEILESCQEFSQSSDVLRKAVDDTVHSYARVLDQLSEGQEGQDLFAEAVAEAESLEHFHLFTRDAAPETDKSLQMHTDMGLFIVMTPASYFQLQDAQPVAMGTADHGLLIEMDNGEVVKPAIREGSLIVMNGEGSNRWMNSTIGDHLRTPPHEVSFPMAEGVGRAWFGRMVLPKRSAKMQGAEEELTFNEYRSQTYQAFRDSRPEEAMSAGCYPRPSAMGATARRSLMQHQDESSCAEDEIYCWMMCMSMDNVTDVTVGCTLETVTCENIETGEPWDSGMCGKCGLVCPEPANGTEPTNGTEMINVVKLVSDDSAALAMGFESAVGVLSGVLLMLAALQ